MAKDKNLAKLKSRFEVRGGVINEFDFHRNQAELAEEERNRFARQEEERRLREGEGEAAAAPQTEAERIQQVIAEAHEKVQERKEKESAPGASRPARSSSAKRAAKLPAQVAGKKGGAKRASAAKKGTAGSAKKRGAKKATAKASHAKKGTKKTGGTKKGSGKGMGKRGGAKKGRTGATRKTSRSR